MMTDTEVLKELKVFRRMMKSDTPYRFLRRCVMFGVIDRHGWVSAVLAGMPHHTKDIAREFFLAELLED